MEAQLKELTAQLETKKGVQTKAQENWRIAMTEARINAEMLYNNSKKVDNYVKAHRSGQMDE